MTAGWSAGMVGRADELAQIRAVRRGDKWRSFAELNGAVLAAPKTICAGHNVGAVGEVITFDLDYAR